LTSPKSSKPAFLKPAFELADVGIAQCRETIRSLADKALAGIVNDNRRVLARQPCLGLQRNPVGRHVGGEQRMARGEDRLVAQIEQRNLLAHQQHAADLRSGDGSDGHGKQAYIKGTWAGRRPSLARLRRRFQPGQGQGGPGPIAASAGTSGLPGRSFLLE
jgi:hypothetical protein